MRIGHKMRSAASYVSQHPGCAKIDVAAHISPHPIPEKHWALGYEPVNRAIKAGLIRAVKHASRYELFPAED